MNKEQAEALLAKYLDGKCSEEEKALLESWYLTYEKKNLPALNDNYRRQQLDKIRKSLPVSGHKLGRISIVTLLKAAAVLLAATAALYYYLPSHHMGQSSTKFAQDIRPGSNQAILTLTDGHKIHLDSTQNGIIIHAQQIKYTNGNAVPGVSLPGADSLLSLTTPKGGQYQVILNDGTKVWLNAASTLRYPARFTSGKRRVEINGEAFFNVAQDQSSPFVVVAGDQQVQVLGTSFNVNNYDNENQARTTLVDGSIRVGLSAAQHFQWLHPGQQARIQGQHIQIDAVDLDEATAWVKGYFKFAGEDIFSIMKQLGRWYNIEIVYQGQISDHFSGRVSRYKNISQVLTMLEETGAVHFTIQGRRIIVEP
ncbi:FecR family protein [bacterium A37T11]|nr:FecR family protein [bacterium A37T11]